MQPKKYKWTPHCLGVESRIYKSLTGKYDWFPRKIIYFRSKISGNWKYGLNPDDCKHTKSQITRIIRDWMKFEEIGTIYEETIQ